MIIYRFDRNANYSFIATNPSPYRKRWRRWEYGDCSTPKCACSISCIGLGGKWGTLAIDSIYLVIIDSPSAVYRKPVG